MTRSAADRNWPWRSWSDSTADGSAVTSIRSDPGYHPAMYRRVALIGLVTLAMGAGGCGSATPSTGPTALSPTPAPVASASASEPGPTPTIPGETAPGEAVTVAVSVVVDGLDSPVDVTNAGDGSGRIFVVEQPGRIRTVRDGALVDRPLLDIVDRISSGGEQGLLGLAFHPDYPTDPRLFVDYTDQDGNTVISQFTVTPSDPDVADAASETVLLRIEQPFGNHNGGAIVFGPDGMLYIAMGDGGSGGDPQGNGRNLGTLLAKILRIDVDVPDGSSEQYVIPPDNPFVDVADARPEVWLTGLRNPWRIRFDPPTGDLWIGDVGQNAWEEIDVARAGGSGLDFGWNVTEGFHCYQPAKGCDMTGLTPPVAEYGHDLGCAVIGGVVVRDQRQGELDGRYLFGDSCSDDLWMIDPTNDGPQDPILLTELGRGLSAFGEGEDGTVYATSNSNGELLRLSSGS
jgi:glucose/arabinose dehydrogenase